MEIIKLWKLEHCTIISDTYKNFDLIYRTFMLVTCMVPKSIGMFTFYLNKQPNVVSTVFIYTEFLERET